MISRPHRLNKAAIGYILKKGHSVHSRYFIVRWRENTEEIFRFCVIISRKFLKNAVPRNRLRRQIYEALRLTQEEEKKTSAPADMVIIPKRAALTATFEELKSDISHLTHGTTS